MHDNFVTKTDREYTLPIKTAALRAEMQRSLGLPVTSIPEVSTE